MNPTLDLIAIRDKLSELPVLSSRVLYLYDAKLYQELPSFKSRPQGSGRPPGRPRKSE